MQGSVRFHTFSSAACVHAVESSDDGSHPSHRSAAMRNGKMVSSKEIKKRVKKLLSPLKQKWRISQSFRSRSKAANSEAMDDDGDQSDAETFVSANSSELRSFCTDDYLELPSFHLSSPIFPIGIVERPPTSSPVRIIHKLPFGYVIGRQLDAPASPSTMITKKVVRAISKRFGRGSRGGKGGRAGEGDDCGDNGDGDDEDAFWKKDVRGLRCRREEDEEPPYRRS